MHSTIVAIASVSAIVDSNALLDLVIEMNVLFRAWSLQPGC